MVKAFEVKIEGINWNEFIKIVELTLSNNSNVEAVIEDNNWIAILQNGRILIIPPDKVDEAINKIKNTIPTNANFTKIGTTNIELDNIDPFINYEHTTTIPLSTVKIKGGTPPSTVTIKKDTPPSTIKIEHKDGASNIKISGGAKTSTIVFK